MSYNEWIDIEVLEDYLDGKLDAKTMHQVEKLSLEDPFVAEALAGLSQSPRRSQSLSLLQKQLQERIAQKPIEQKRWRLTAQRLSIGAAAAVLFVVASLLFWMRESNNREQLAKQSKKVDVLVAPQVADNQKNASPKAEPETLVNSAVMDKALADANKALATTKTNSYAQLRNKQKATVPLVADKTLTDAIEPSARQEVAVAAAPVAVAMQARVLKVDSLSEVVVAKREAKPLNQALSSKAPGITFSPDIFSGTVISKIDGMPISGADVKVANSNLRTTTNSKGEFSLKLDSAKNQNLTVNFIGFNAKEVNVKANKSVIELEPSNQSLSEVMVVSAGKAKRSTANTSLVPSEGWDKYKNYLNSNNKLLKGATSGKAVLLSFEIDSNGKPNAIKVVKGLSQAENEEAIRLVKEGPTWVRQSRSESKVELSIEF